MLTITGTGRVTVDLAVQEISKGNKFLKFGFAVNKGHGGNQKTVFLQCLLYGEQQVRRMVKAKVQKGSLIAVNGELDVAGYTKKDGIPDKTIEVILYDWSYVAFFGKPKDETAAPETNAADENLGSDKLFL